MTQNGNSLILATSHLPSTIIETAGQAAAAAAKAEIEASYAVAIRCPRNIEQARLDFLAACKRPGFAEKAIYKKKVGKKQLPSGDWVDNVIEDLSIRAAEEAIRAMRNIRIASVTVYEDDDIRKKKISVTDLEANISYNREITLGKTVERKGKKEKDGTFTPPGDRSVIGDRTNSYGDKVFIVLATEDELNIKEAALTSKIIRTEGLRLVPSDIQEEAKEQCYATMADHDAKDPKAAMRKVLDAFSGIGVNPAMLVAYLGHPLEQTQPAEMADLRKMFSAIREGEATWKSFTETEQGETKPEIKAPKAKKQYKQPSTDGLVKEINAMLLVLPVGQSEKAFRAVEFYPENGEALEQLPDDKLIALRSLLASAK